MTNRKHFDQHRRLLKDTNPNAALISFGILILLIIGVLILASCQKESSFTSRQTPQIESDKHLVPPDGFNLAKRVEGYGVEAAGKGKGRDKPKGKPTQPQDTTDQDPPTDTTGTDEPNNQPPTGQGVILLDFDGQYVTGTAWNLSGAIDCKPSNQTTYEQQQILERVRQDYSEFAVTVTADSTLYWSAPVNKRMRVIITESWEWYSQAGGVAYLGSFTWGDNTPCFVFNSLLGYNTKNVSDAISHEAGHTLNLRHQGKCDGTQYNGDLAPDGLGYLMGYPYNHESGWQVGVTPQCFGQDDRAIIRAALK